MKIRRFKWNPDKPGGWEPHHLYAEFHDGVMQFIATKDDTTREWTWTLADAEVFVAMGSWVELGTSFIPQTVGDWPEDFEHENGNYQSRCVACKELFMGHKRRAVCRVCYRASLEPALVAPRTMDSAELFQHFRNFRYAQMGVNGLGSAYPDALAFIDNEVKIRVAETLKGLK